MKIFIALLAAMIFIGCASINRYDDPLVLNECKKLDEKGLKQTYQFDFSQVKNTGKLIIFSQPASMQWMIENYYFTVNNQNIKVFKYSDTTITLDPGKYVIEGNCKGFGFAATIEVNIVAGKQVGVVFRGPLDIMTKGKFWQLKEIQ